MTLTGQRKKTCKCTLQQHRQISFHGFSLVLLPLLHLQPAMYLSVRWFQTSNSTLPVFWAKFFFSFSLAWLLKVTVHSLLPSLHFVPFVPSTSPSSLTHSCLLPPSDWTQLTICRWYLRLRLSSRRVFSLPRSLVSPTFIYYLTCPYGSTSSLFFDTS